MNRHIGITLGDPKGIGPEVVAKSLPTLPGDIRARVKIYGDDRSLDNARKLIEGRTPNSFTSEIGDQEAAKMAIAAIDAAVFDAQNGEISAIVTAPVNKARLRTVRPGFVGHTEYLAGLAGISDATMMFISEEGAGNPIFISPATTHIPLGSLSKNLTSKCILTTIQRTAGAIRAFTKRTDVRLAVAALNPHAGENGALGFEEHDIIMPAIRAAKAKGIDCEGPFPSDSLFAKLRDFEYDGVVTMYHDQGMIPIKLMSRGCCVNITLGLPYVRTSPGHGTAEDIAWHGKADERAMLMAIKIADRLLQTELEE